MIMTIIASIGTAAVPSAGIVMLIIILESFQISGSAIGLIIGVDRLLDMLRTAVNVTGDAAVTCVIAKTEGHFSEEKYRDTSAGLMPSK